MEGENHVKKASNPALTFMVDNKLKAPTILHYTSWWNRVFLQSL
jgi:hypothetical protein